MTKCIFSAAALALLAACPLTVGAKPQTDLKPVVKGNTAFGLALYEQLREEEGNLFFSSSVGPPAIRGTPF